MKQTEPVYKKDTSYPTLAIVFTFMVWIPFINLFTGVLALVFGVLGLLRIRKDPNHYGGSARAIIAIVVHVIFIFMLVYAIVSQGWSAVFSAF